MSLWFAAIFNIKADEGVPFGHCNVGYSILKLSNAEIGNCYKPQRAGSKTPIFYVITFINEKNH